jgi:hypothetical protein
MENEILLNIKGPSVGDLAVFLLNSTSGTRVRSVFEKHGTQTGEWIRGLVKLNREDIYDEFKLSINARPLNAARGSGIIAVDEGMTYFFLKFFSINC